MYLCRSCWLRLIDVPLPLKSLNVPTLGSGISSIFGSVGGGRLWILWYFARGDFRRSIPLRLNTSALPVILSSALYSSTETKIVVASYIDLVLVCIVIAVSFHALIPLVLPIHGSSVSVHSLYVFLPSTTCQCKEEHYPICVYSAYVILFPL